MGSETATIRDVALALPEDDRADLAYRLLQSLQPPGHLSEGSVEFASALERRMAAYEAGARSAADWDTASGRLRQAWKDRKPS
jgi:putative addiction module component (TIGR02574 family)